MTAVAVGPGGEVVCGTSPGGRLWRVDPKAKEPAKAGTPAGETGEAAVWSLAFAPDGTVFAGTGAKGRIWKAGRDGKASLHAEVEDTHVRSLLVLGDGTLVAGTSDHGLVVAIDGRRKGPDAPRLRAARGDGARRRDPAERSWPWRRPWRCRRSRSSEASPARRRFPRPLRPGPGSGAGPGSAGDGLRLGDDVARAAGGRSGRLARRERGSRPHRRGRLRGARLDPPGGDGLRGTVGRRKAARFSSRPALAAASTA